jgi:hypothetical protein
MPTGKTTGICGHGKRFSRCSECHDTLVMCPEHADDVRHCTGCVLRPIKKRTCYTKCKPHYKVWKSCNECIKLREGTFPRRRVLSSQAEHTCAQHAKMIRQFCEECARNRLSSKYTNIKLTPCAAHVAECIKCVACDRSDGTTGTD